MSNNNYHKVEIQDTCNNCSSCTPHCLQHRKCRKTGVVMHASDYITHVCDLHSSKKKESDNKLNSYDEILTSEEIDE